MPIANGFSAKVSKKFVLSASEAKKKCIFQPRLMRKLYLILTRYDSFENEDDVSIFWVNFPRKEWL